VHHRGRGVRALPDPARPSATHAAWPHGHPDDVAAPGPGPAHRQRRTVQVGAPGERGLPGCDPRSQHGRPDGSDVVSDTLRESDTWRETVLMRCLTPEGCQTPTAQARRRMLITPTASGCRS